MITCNLRESTRLTGSLGVATITSFGDATALVTDILAPKTAYIATGKVTGTCTFDSDTSAATAAESDILRGKTAYAGGVELTGTNTNNADTTDATLTANDMLHGVTGYGADGTKLTGAGAYWQYVKKLKDVFSGSTELPARVIIRAPNATGDAGGIFSNTTGATEINLTTGPITNFFGTFNACSPLTLDKITLNCNLSGCTDIRYLFQSQTNLTQILGTPMDLSSVTSDLNSFNAPKLEIISIAPSTINISIRFWTCPLLSTASLLSIANGLNAASVPNTLTMHATSKTNMNSINVDVVDGVAVIGTTKTLMQFVNTDKGWTVA